MFGDAPIAELRGGLPTMTPDGHFIVDRLPGTGGLYVASGCNVGGLSISPPIGEDLAALDRRRRRPAADARDAAHRPLRRSLRRRGAAARGLLRDVRAQVRHRRGGGPATRRRRHRGSSRTDEHHRRTARGVDRSPRRSRSSRGRPPAWSGRSRCSSRSSSTSRRATRSARGSCSSCRSSCCSRGRTSTSRCWSPRSQLLRVDDVRPAQRGDPAHRRRLHDQLARAAALARARRQHRRRSWAACSASRSSATSWPRFALSPALGGDRRRHRARHAGQVERRTSQPTTRPSSSSRRSP